VLYTVACVLCVRRLTRGTTTWRSKCETLGSEQSSLEGLQASLQELSEQDHEAKVCMCVYVCVCVCEGRGGTGWVKGCVWVGYSMLIVGVAVAVAVAVAVCVCV